MGTMIAHTPVIFYFILLISSPVPPSTPTPSHIILFSHKGLF